MQPKINRFFKKEKLFCEQTCEASEVKVSYFTILPEINTIYKLNLKDMPATTAVIFFSSEQAEIA